MPMEVTCGQCHGQLLVESTGVVVACPHCGAHLEIPDEDVPAEAPAESHAESAAEWNSASAAAPSSVTDALAALGMPPAPDAPDSDHQTALEDPSSHVYEPPEELTLPEELVAEAAAAEQAPPTGDSFPSFPQSETVDEPPAARAETAASDNPFAFLSTPGAPAPDTESPATGETGFEPSPAAAQSFPVVVDSPLPAESAEQPRRAPEPPRVASLQSLLTAEQIPRKYVIIVASYASAVTLILFYLLFLRPVRTHQLESLPDLKPPVDKNGEIGMRIAPPDADVAPGHVLRLGESRRFGNVLVTPLKVTRSRLTFRHFDKLSKAKRDPSEPVLKLWLKLENVSSNQTFAPLDRLVVYKRGFADSGVVVKTNTFLGEETEREQGRKGSLHYLYPLPEESEWLIDGQKIDDELAPGASIETFLPSEEGVELTGNDLVWRIQFRKGYNPTSHRGVLTLVDVRFRADQVEDDAGPSA